MSGTGRCMSQSGRSVKKARSEPIHTTAWSIKHRAETGSGGPQRKNIGPPCHIDPPIYVGRAGFQSVRRAATINSATLGPSGCGGLDAWHPTVGSAEREVSAAGHAELQGLVRPTSHSYLTRCCLTLRSSGAPTAGRQGPA